MGCERRNGMQAGSKIGGQPPSKKSDMLAFRVHRVRSKTKTKKGAHDLRSIRGSFHHHGLPSADQAAAGRQLKRQQREGNAPTRRCRKYCLKRGGGLGLCTFTQRVDIEWLWLRLNLTARTFEDLAGSRKGRIHQPHPNDPIEPRVVSCSFSPGYPS